MFSSRCCKINEPFLATCGLYFLHTILNEEHESEIHLIQLESLIFFQTVNYYQVFKMEDYLDLVNVYYENAVEQITIFNDYCNFMEGNLDRYLRSSPITYPLVLSQFAKNITYSLTAMFVVLAFSETFYWTGIYLGLWEYHAKDIFKEIPVHCAHVYIRLNTVESKEDLTLIKEYFENHRDTLLHPKISNNLQLPYKLPTKPITYNFEFSPEDFEMNDDPEFGSTVSHLRTKILNTFKESPRGKMLDKASLLKISESNVIVFNHKYALLDSSFDNEYLSKCAIETGDTINSFIAFNID